MQKYFYSCLQPTYNIIVMFRFSFLSKFYRFSKIQVVQGEAADTAGMDNISKMPFYQSFKEGLNLTLENKLEEANQHFQKSLNMLQERKEQLNEHYLHIYKKLVQNQIVLKRYAQAQEKLYKLIKMKKKINYQSILIYDDYNSLFRFFLNYNVQKAILLGKALLTDKEVEAMSLKHKKLFQFNLANSYFFVGNYADAKSKYFECLSNGPDSDLKSRIYNNLGLACWWHKNPLFDEKIVETKIVKQQIDSDYKQSREILLKAIETSENPQSILQEEQKYKLRQAINEYELDINTKFKKVQSILPIYNLIQYYINNEPNQKVKIIFWLRILLNLSQSTKYQSIYDEAFATLCLLLNDKSNLMKFLPVAIKKYSGKFEEVYYNKLMTFFSQGSSLIESNKYKKISQDLQLQFLKEDKYIFKRKYLSVFDLKL